MMFSLRGLLGVNALGAMVFTLAQPAFSQVIQSQVIQSQAIQSESIPNDSISTQSVSNPSVASPPVANPPPTNAPVYVAVPVQLNNGLKIQNSSGDAYLQLNGRVQIDYINATRESETIVNDAEVQRAWLTLSGARGDWYFLHRFDVDPEPEGSKLSSFIEYRGLGAMAWVSAGRHKEPFGMRWRTSINNVATPERSAISDAHTLGRSVGVMMRGYGKHIGYEAGVFEDGAVAGSNQETATKGAFTGRVFVPLNFSGGEIAHVGVGTSQRSLKDAYNLELAYIHHRFHVQTEWLQTRWPDGENEDGVAVDVGWFFTDDSVVYKNGAFQKVVPSVASGAWQIVLRVDEGVGNYSDIQLARGEGNQVAVGLNWFANANTRFAVSYTTGEMDEVMVNGELIEASGDELRARLQFTF